MKALKFILFLLGFPVLVALVALASLNVIEQGLSYGFWPFIGLIVACLFFIVYLITFIVTGKKAKKATNLKKVKNGIIALVIVSFVCTAGLWLVIDIPLPGILSTATSGTILFDDVREDYTYHADVHGKLLDDFITLNYNNGNLDNSYDLETYLEEGYRNEDVKKLIETNFKSIDKGGYVSYINIGPWINLANDKRMTIPCIVTLITAEREYELQPFQLKYEVMPDSVITEKDVEDGKPVYDWAHKEDYAREDELAPVRWTVLDMDGKPMEVPIGSVSGLLASINPALAGVSPLVMGILEEFGPSICNSIVNLVSHEDVAGAPIYISLDISDGDTATLTLRPSNEQRGMLGYQNSAWLNSNNLIFALISIFPVRQVLYIWSAVVIALSLAIGAIRLKEAKKKLGITDDGVVVAPVVAPSIYDNVPEDATPYEKTYFSAQAARKR